MFVLTLVLGLSPLSIWKFRKVDRSMPLGKRHKTARVVFWEGARLLSDKLVRTGAGHINNLIT